MIRAFAIVLLLVGCAEVPLPEYDPGGNPQLAMARVIDAREHGREVAIRGICFSSCALKLAAGPSLCVAPSAQIGVHEVRWTPDNAPYEQGNRHEVWTAFFEGMLPPCARQLFAQLGGFKSGRLVTVSGQAILTACPQIQACQT